MQSLHPDISRVAALRAIRGNLLRLKWHAAALRFELALRRHDRTLKYGYNEDEPRIPKHQDGGGRWTTGLIHLAGDVPTNDSPEPDDPPKVPKERPKTSVERTAVLKTMARWIARYSGAIGKVIEVGSWAYEYSALIRTYNDPPKSLEELKEAASTPEAGYNIHHVVEQTSAARDGFSRKVIDAPDNLVRIPTMKHWEINAWYQTENPEFGGKTPREYLAGRNWDVRKAVGLQALKKAGVLKP